MAKLECFGIPGKTLILVPKFLNSVKPKRNKKIDLSLLLFPKRLLKYFFRLSSLQPSQKLKLKLSYSEGLSGLNGKKKHIWIWALVFGFGDKQTDEANDEAFEKNYGHYGPHVCRWLAPLKVVQISLLSSQLVIWWSTNRPNPRNLNKSLQYCRI